MVPLSIGDHVSALDGSHEGKLVDIDGTTGYVMQTNGVEVEFPLNRLKPYETPKVAEQRTLAGPLRDTALSPRPEGPPGVSPGGRDGRDCEELRHRRRGIGITSGLRGATRFEEA